MPEFKRLLIIVEGEAEEQFVKDVLAPDFINRNLSVCAKLNGEGGARAKRKGIKSWLSVSRDIIRLLREDERAYISTFVDYYALPSGDDGNAWPGRKKAAEFSDIENKAHTIEAALLRDLQGKCPDIDMERRFIPYISMHEFEALLFSDPDAFARGIGKEIITSEMYSIKAKFPTPEHINDSPHTAPSKRLEEIFRALSCGRYQKPIFGVIGAKGIGLAKIRSECKLFDQWLRRLEDIFPILQNQAH